MRRSISTIPPIQGRSGAALMEVLIALMAMGIGVVSLMALFPLSVVRTAQAHQLTVGTGLRLNVEAFLDNNRYVWIDPDRDGNTNEHAAESFLFDPLALQRGLTTDFGGAASPLVRYNGGYDTLPKALGLCVYDGNWITQADEATVQTLTAANSINLGVGTNLSAVPTVNSRIVLFNQAGNTSLTRTITSIVSPLSSPTVGWSAAEPVTLDVSRARIETGDEQFTWMFSFRRHDADNLNNPYGDLFLAVFFRREYSAESETVYQNNAGAASVFISGSTTATIQYGTVRPSIKRGGYVLDSDHGYWYRVSNYIEDTTTNTITMALEFPAQANSSGAVFFRGLVDVYYLGTQK